MATSHLDLQYRFFVVGERPFCLWDFDIKPHVVMFLDSIDPSYFEYVADANLKWIQEAAEDDPNARGHAAIALRAAYGQALETLFALIAAFLQAPRCLPAWLALYKTQEVFDIVRAIDQSASLRSQFQLEKPSWRSVAELILSWLVLEDKEKEKAVKQGLADLWRRFASDFLDQGSSNEYNSIKHGFRIRPGGFHLSIGTEDKPGQPAPPERMHLLGKSDFGSSFLVPTALGEWPHHVQLVRHSRNWAPEDFAWGLHLISLSLTNVISAAKVINEVPATDVKLHWPSELSVLSEPWKRRPTVGVTSMRGPHSAIAPDLINPYSRADILQRYSEGNDAGIRRVKFGPTPSTP